jgi:long-chain acyl-CoA synthetase
MKTEGIEALVFPNPEFNWNSTAGSASPDTIKERIDAIISEVNQRLLAYQKIGRTVILDKPMEMTTTKKIKRDSV